MARKDLKNKPLVEAIIEVKWALAQQSPSMHLDPHYRLLLGRFSERVQKDYPFHEPLPTAQIPDGMVAQMVQHRFRTSENRWPLAQIGPGIMTVNETSGYIWADFQKQCEDVVSKLFDAYPVRSDFKIQDLTLRYIDAVEFNFDRDNIFDFLGEKLKTKICLPESLFQGTNICKNPTAFNWQASFKICKPGGIVTLRFATGQREGVPSLIWETLVQSSGDKLPSLPEGFPKWLEEAHVITDDWFFKLIEGELERRFSGEQ
ncbi:MAG: TIGR04255 family protein [Chitinivibrionales bacterium]|nr:TIGR04255 family protein [Chitinivibrionales bacterium]